MEENEVGKVVALGVALRNARGSSNATAGSSRRVLPEGCCFCSTVSTLLSPQGAGRIQSLRAFRRAGVIHAMVRRCSGVAVQWSAWRESSFQEGSEIKNGQLVLGNGHNEIIRWALIVRELAQVGAKLVPD